MAGQSQWVETIVTRQQLVAAGGFHPALPLHESSLPEEGRQARLLYNPRVYAEQVFLLLIQRVDKTVGHCTGLLRMHLTECLV